MIIFFEGIDGSGKTTTVKPVMQKLFDYRMISYDIKMVNPRDLSYKEVQQLYSALLAQVRSDAVYVYDRGPISEIAYRMWDHKEGGYILSEFMKFFEEASKLRCGVVFFNRNPIRCFEQRTETEHDDVDCLNDLLIVEERYNNILSVLTNYLKLRMITYNVDIDEDVDKIISFIRRL